MFLFKKLLWIAIKFLIRLKFPKVPYISTADLAAWLKEDKAEKPLLLDARTPEEYAISHLQGAELIPANLEDLKLDPSKPIVVYCSIGYRSAVAARQLQAMGYEKTLNLEGSIFQWANEQRPVYKGEQVSDRVHPYNRFWGYLLDRDRK
ncbi:sulfurtransferase [Hydrococcus rivularis NIES-593]|uniref:Sulfurtransferase n=1 Tax=Hydrococcus rivularis NIES-593 TaxID=1921803 RepID=A0A1U7HGB1_9CYAN|nr:sulfurtransferase [Hydrococcus rivularis NIES-593]